MAKVKLVDKVNITIAEDHLVYRKGLRQLLKKNKDVGWVDTAENGEDLLERLQEREPDIVFLDLSMPRMDGEQVVRILRKDWPHIKVIVLSVFEDMQIIQQMLNLGVNAYLTKSCSEEEIFTAMNAVIQDNHYHTKLVSDVMREMITANNQKYDLPISNRLNPIEEEIVRLVAEGRSSKQIAREVFLGKSTVDAYRSKLIKRLGVKNLAGLIKWGVNNGYV